MVHDVCVVTGCSSQVHLGSCSLLTETDLELSLCPPYLPGTSTFLEPYTEHQDTKWLNNKYLTKHIRETILKC